MWTPAGIPSAAILTPPGNAVSIANRTVTDVSEIAPLQVNAIARWHMHAGGNVRTFARITGYVSIPGEWMLIGPSSAYHVRFTSAAGDAPNDGSPLNTWLQCNQHRYVGMINSSGTPTMKEGDVLVEISDDGGSSVLDSATITLRAIRTDNV